MTIDRGLLYLPKSCQSTGMCILTWACGVSQHLLVLRRIFGCSVAHLSTLYIAPLRQCLFFFCSFLANVNSCSCSLYVVVRPSVCLSSVTFVHPTQRIEIFGNVSTPFNTLVIWRHPGKFYGDRPRGTPPSGELNTRGVAVYSDFGPIGRYISETVQDMR